MLNRKPRAGTVISISACFFAVIGVDSYEKLLKRDIQTKMTNNVTFLRQIPYVTHWYLKEVQGLYMYCTEQKSTYRG